jgi:diadenosine tetraphosphate (Ap4A) HIT family hydrolase
MLRVESCRTAPYEDFTPNPEEGSDSGRAGGREMEQPPLPSSRFHDFTIKKVGFKFQGCVRSTGCADPVYSFNLAAMGDLSNACIFCEPKREIIAQNECAIAVFDSFPVSPGHALVLPRRHVATIWDLDETEYGLCFRLVRYIQPILAAKYSPHGFNVGVNCGEAAGQSVWHAHVHVIPRYTGDTENPRGGVRHVIPLKGNY